MALKIAVEFNLQSRKWLVVHYTYDARVSYRTIISYHDTEAEAHQQAQRDANDRRENAREGE